MTNEQILKTIDHTNISRQASKDDILQTIAEAKEYGFRGVCVNPEWVKLVSQELKNTNLRTVVLLDPPMGLSSHQERVAMTKKVKQDGADDLDIVINIVDLKYERYDKVLNDLKEITPIGSTKVIIGSGYLTDKEIAKASQLVKKSGADCVKTATFKDPLQHRELPEKFKHLKIMAQNAPGLKIKVAGKIRTAQDARQAIKAGADIIGTSSGVEIAEGLR